MPNPSASNRPLLLRLVLLALAGASLLLTRRSAASAAAEPPTRPLADEPPPHDWLARARAASEFVPVPPRGPRRARRLLAGVAVTVCFSLGAALSAGAGDRVAELIEADAVPAEAQAEPAAPAESVAPTPAPTPPASAEEEVEAARGGTKPALPLAPPTVDGAAEPPPAEPPAEDTAPAEEPAAAHRGVAAATAPPAAAPQPAARSDRRPTALPVLTRAPAPRESLPLEPEATVSAGATVWLHRTLSDPTPPSRRLTSRFAQRLAVSARRVRADWALVLGVLRARGELGSVPAGARQLALLTRRLARKGADADGWAAVLALTGDTATADEALALAHYHRAVGLAALVRGLEWSKRSLQRRLLTDERVAIYAGGRSDIAAGAIDVRVLVLIAYLAEAHGSVTVTSLVSGHRLFARPGVVSAHIYGQAVDVAAVGGVPVLGHQEPGGVTERAVRSILLLPAELRPRQVISLLGLGGPSFPMADHGDHIHVGY